MNKLINLVIPCAGKSQRFFEAGFTKHKFFLPLKDNFNILETIINSFDLRIFKPHIILTRSQIKLYETEICSIKKKFPNLELHTIDEHSLGPTYSIMQINIPDEEQIVVHYCDFLTKFNHDELIYLLSKKNIVAPYFSGFHPASLGTTNFAYMILDSISNLINLQEKKPFTNNRILEPASTGIYGFPSFKIFKYLANILFKNQDNWKLSEAYTSLLLNVAIDEKLVVKCFKVQKFICLGTPRDYEEYLFWSNIYNKISQESKTSFEGYEHLITAAGKGSRFKKENYRMPKILNIFYGKNLLEGTIESMKGANTKVLILKEVESTLKKKFFENKNVKTKTIVKTTNGQLISLKELLKINIKSNSFFVSSADYRFYFNKTIFEEFLIKNEPEIVIFTTQWKHYANEKISNYGFVKTNNDNNQILEIIEKPKNKISDDLTKNLLIGTFWFKNKKIIDLLSIDPNENNEVFIASAINKLIKNMKIYSFNVEYWLSLGTPKELDLAKYWFDYFENKNF